MKRLIIALFLFLSFFSIVNAETLKPDNHVDYDYTKKVSLSFLNGQFVLNNSINIIPFISANGNETSLKSSGLSNSHSVINYGYKRKWGLTITKPVLTTSIVDYVKFTINCDYYSGLTYHCGNIEVSFDDLIEQGYSVMIDGRNITIYGSFIFSSIILDPTDQLLPNVTNKAYSVSSTLTDSSDNATTEFTSTQYTNIQSSNNVYVTSTAQQSITQSCVKETGSCTCGGACADGCEVYVNTCGTPILYCNMTYNASYTNNCGYNLEGQCLPPAPCKIDCGTLCRCNLPTGSCTYTCDANNYWNGSSCNLTASWIYTFQRFTFNISDYYSMVDNMTYCWEGLYNSSGGSSDGKLLFYNVTSSSWVSFKTLTANNEATSCLSFGINLTSLYNSTSGLVMFASRGNQSKSGHLLTLYSDYAYLNVSYTPVTTTTTSTTTSTTTETTTSTTTETTTSTTESTTTTPIPLIPIENTGSLCFSLLSSSYRPINDILNVTDSIEVRDDYPNTNYYIEPAIPVLNRTIERRSYFKFNNSLPNVTLTDAKLWLYSYLGSSGLQNVSVYHVYNQSWSDYWITWNNQPCGQSMNTSQCDYTIVDSSYLDPVPNRWFTYNVTDIINQEILAGNSNISFVLATPYAALGGMTWFASKYISENTTPFISTTYLVEKDPISSYGKLCLCDLLDYFEEYTVLSESMSEQEAIYWAMQFPVKGNIFNSTI